MPWFRTTKRPACSTLRANGSDAMTVSPTRTIARNDVQNRAEAPEGGTTGRENRQSRSGAADGKGLTVFFMGGDDAEIRQGNGARRCRSPGAPGRRLVTASQPFRRDLWKILCGDAR